MEKANKYQIIKSQRKTLSLTIKEGAVLVRAPFGVSETYIAAFVEKHARWIEKRLKSYEERPILNLRDGATITMFGTNYLLCTGRDRIEGGCVYLRAENREEAFVKLIKKFSLEVMSVLTERIAARYRFHYSHVRISSARGRWGSCNKERVIAYTFRVAFLAPELCEYVVVHELAHTVQFDHSPAFWKIVEQILPDWKERRRKLKLSGAMQIL